MAEYADLEIGLHSRDSGSYAVEFRFSQPNSEADVRMGQDQPALFTPDRDALGQAASDPRAYGKMLTAAFFAEPAIRTAFAQARTSSETLGVMLRVRLMLGASASDLHSLHWETLCDPQDGSLIATNENLLFSRYLSSLDWRPVHLRAKGDLRALLAAANPTNLKEYKLAAVDVPGELGRAQLALGSITVDALGGPDKRATLNNLVSGLRNNEHDILYLIAHGAVVKGEPYLWLEDEAGNVARTSGADLVARIKELELRPRLVILASCESAGDGTGNALSALGPRLAEAGIPAVLAMQGKVSIDMLAEFMPLFFQELQKDGQVDRAMAVARGAVRQYPDYWMPVLFMRLKSGRIWYVPGFGEETSEFEKWQSLAGFIHDKTCTPILGPGLQDSQIGSRRDIAVEWADKHGFPMATEDKDQLPRVAQYILTQQSPAYLPVAYRESLRKQALRRYSDKLPEALLQANVWSNTQLTEALDVIAQVDDLNGLADPYRVLASLRLPIYLTTGSFDFMSQAIIAAGNEPVIRICPWNKWIPKPKAVYEEEPTPEKPLVYHLFGHISIPNSLVFSEDNFFDYLIGVTQNKSLIPSAVRAALSNTSLLFLGFQMEDWEFRVFFRFLMMQEGREMLKFYSHAAAQIEPEEDRIQDVKRARKYLEEYFEGENIGIFWGSSDEFPKGLQEHL
jgi:hypothetical protein